MIVLPNKDPDEILKYEIDWTGRFADGDSISTDAIAAVVAAGTTASISSDGAISTVEISGGTVNLAAGYTVTVTTANAETLEEYLFLQIVGAAPPDPAFPTTYVIPTVEQFLFLFPEFAGVPNIAFYIQLASGFVDEGWVEKDYAMAIALLAAHEMATKGLGTSVDARDANSEYRTVRSGQLTLTRYASGERGGDTGSAMSATSYGRRYLGLLALNFSGPVVISGNGAPVSGYAKDWPPFYWM